MPPAAADESEQVSGAGAGAGKAGHGAGERAAGSAGALTGPLDATDPGARQPGRSATSRDGAKSAQCSARKDRALAFLASVIPVLTDYRHDAPERRQRPVASRTPGKFGNRDDIPNASGGNIYAVHRPGTVGIVTFVPSP